MAIRGVDLGFVAVAAALSACQPAGHGRDIEAVRAWARATAPGQDSGGVFLTVHGGREADRLIGGSTEAARSVEIHTMRMDGAVMRMRRQQAVEIPAAGEVTLEPGGTHLMLNGLKAPLATGRSFRLALEFARTGRKEVVVKVLPIGATGPRDGRDE